MKTCAYCGRESMATQQACSECGTVFPLTPERATDWKRAWSWGALAGLVAFVVSFGIGYVGIATNEQTSFPPYAAWIQAVPISFIVLVFAVLIGARVFKKPAI